MNAISEAIPNVLSTLPLTAVTSPQLMGQGGTRGFASRLAAAQSSSTAPPTSVAAGPMPLPNVLSVTNLPVGQNKKFASGVLPILGKNVATIQESPAANVALGLAPLSSPLPAPVSFPSNVSQVTLSAVETLLPQPATVKTPGSTTAGIRTAVSVTASLPNQLTNSSLVDGPSFPPTTAAAPVIPTANQVQTNVQVMDTLPINRSDLKLVPDASVQTSITASSPETVFAGKAEPPDITSGAAPQPSVSLPWAAPLVYQTSQIHQTNQTPQAIMPGLLAELDSSSQPNSSPANDSPQTSMLMAQPENAVAVAGSAAMTGSVMPTSAVGSPSNPPPAFPLPPASPKTAPPANTTNTLAPPVANAAPNSMTLAFGNGLVEAAKTPFAVFFSTPGTESGASVLPKLILSPGNSAPHASPTSLPGSIPTNSASGGVVPSLGVQPLKSAQFGGQSESPQAGVAPHRSTNSILNNPISNNPSLTNATLLNAVSTNVVAAASSALQAASPTASLSGNTTALPAPLIPSPPPPAAPADSLPKPELGSNPGNTTTPQVQPTPLPGPVQIAQMVSRIGQSEMRIGMNTSAFGTVEVRTTVHSNDVGLIIGSEKGDLRGLLSNEMPALTNNLQQQNLRLNTVNFTQGGAFSNNMSGGGDSQQQSFLPRPSTANYGNPSSAAANDAVETQIVATSAWAGGSLSILA